MIVITVPKLREPPYPLRIVKQSQKRLARRTVWLDELRRNQLDGMAMRAEPARPIMSTPTRFQAKNHGRQLRDKGHQGLTCQAFPQHDLPRIIHACHMTYPLCEIDPDYTKILKILLYEPCLLLCGMISAEPEIILAYGSHSAKAGPLH
jgi:hypothetical protein